jgi:hypothetical protein
MNDYTEKDFRVILSGSLSVYFPLGKAFHGDLYHFIFMCIDRHKNADFGQFMADWFEHWREEVKSMRNQQALFVPIEWGDQYFGGLRITQETDGTMTVSYGFINNPDGKSYAYFERDFLDDIALSFSTTKERILQSLTLEVQ